MNPFSVVKILLAFMTCILVCCIGIEVNRYFDEVEVVNSFARMAAEEALLQQQDLFAEWNSTGSASAAVSELKRYNLISADAAEKISEIIREDLVSASPEEAQKYLCPGAIKRYADEVASQAIDEGLTSYNVVESDDVRWDVLAGMPSHNWEPGEYETEVYDDLIWLSENATKEDANYNPMQMGMTYAHEGLLEILFEENFKRLIEDNYGLGAENTSRNPRVGLLRYYDCDVSVKRHTSADGSYTAKVVKLTEGEEGAAIYKELFGIGDSGEAGGELVEEEAVEQYDAWDQYAVVYDITFTAETLHTMKTLLGQEGGPQSIVFGLNQGATDGGPDAGTNEQWTEVAGQRYATLRMPVVELDRRYSILH